jgi:hypothetical protein
MAAVYFFPENSFLSGRDASPEQSSQQRNFHQTLVRLTARRLSDRLLVGEKGRLKPLFAGFRRAAFLVRDNLRHRADIEEAYLEAIGAANEEIILAAAYFFPACVSAMHWWMPPRAACA